MFVSSYLQRRLQQFIWENSDVPNLDSILKSVDRLLTCILAELSSAAKFPKAYVSRTTISSRPGYFFSIWKNVLIMEG